VSADTAIDFGKAMTVGDFVEVRAALKVEYLLVGSLVSGTTYNVTRNLDGSGSDDWPAGSVWQAKRNGAGFIDLNSYDTPRVQLLTQGATYNAQTEVIRLGDLNANWGYSSATYGLAVGVYAAATVNLTMDPTNGYRLRTYNVTQFSVTPNLLKFGSDVSAAATTAIAIMGAAQTYNSEALGVGDLLIGDNTASKANILWDKSAGTLLFRGGTTTQVTIDTTGALKWGAGNGVLDNTGIKILTPTSWAGTEPTIGEGYTLYNSANSILIGGLFGKYDNGSNAFIEVNCVSSGVGYSRLTLNTDDGTDNTRIQLDSSSPSGSTIEIVANDGISMGPGALHMHSINSTTALLVEQYGVKDNVLVVDTTNGAVGIMQAATSGVPLSVYGRGDGGSVLRLNTSRAWEFQQENADGANAFLRLRDLNTNKRFFIDTSGVFAVRKVDASATIAYFDCANNRLGLGGDTSPAEVLDVTGNINCTGVYKVDDVQVVSNRGAHIADADGSLSSVTAQFNTLLTRLETHGLLAAS
jgi:hypothetical protein